MEYTAEDKEDKKYKGKGYTRKEFKEDVKEAVEPVVKDAAKKTKMKMKKGYGKSSYKNMTAAELRKLINEKKKSLLVKSGFPDGKVPRSKEAMINLCVKLKRKRW